MRNKLEKSKQITIAEIESKKAALKKEINRLENKYAVKTEQVKKRVDSTMKPIQQIRKHPFTTVSLAVLTGFIVGSVTGGGRKKYSGDKGSSLTSLIGTELKRLAARRTISVISDYVDDEIIPRFKKNRSGKASEEDFLDS